MSDIYLLLTPVLAFGVLALASFVGCDRALSVHEFTKDNPLVVGENLMDPRNDYTGWVGMTLVPQDQAQLIYAIGRFCLAGNNQTHEVKIVDAGTGMDVPHATAVVDLAGQPANQFAYAQLVYPATLEANLKYYVLSQEKAGGDQFFDYTTTLTLDSGAPFVVPSAAYGDPDAMPPIPVVEIGGTNQSYGPVSVHFVKSD